MKTIYWGAAICELDFSRLVAPTLTNVKEDLINNEYYDSVNEPTGLKLDGWLTCPAATGILKNMYALRSGMEIKIKFNDNGNITVQFPGAKNKMKNKGGLNMLYHTLAENVRRNTVLLRNKDTRFITLDINAYLFSEHETFVEQLQPWLENTDLSRNTSSVIGGYDISKWFRTLQPTFLMHNNELHIKPGDALCYIKLPPNEKYKLVQFDVNKEIVNHSAHATAFKFLKAHSTMNRLYKLFLGKKMNKTLLKLIKQNIIK